MQKCQKSTCLKLMDGIFSKTYRIASGSTFYLTVLGITIPSFKSIGKFGILKLINKKPKIVLFKIDILTFW